MWAGVRSTHGATKGRVCFEVKIDNNQPTDHLQNETTPNVLRCGWYDFLQIPTVGLQKKRNRVKFTTLGREPVLYQLFTTLGLDPVSAM